MIFLRRNPFTDTSFTGCNLVFATLTSRSVVSCPCSLMCRTTSSCCRIFSDRSIISASFVRSRVTLGHVTYTLFDFSKKIAGLRHQNPWNTSSVDVTCIDPAESTKISKAAREVGNAATVVQPRAVRTAYIETADARLTISKRASSQRPQRLARLQRILRVYSIVLKNGHN